MHHGQEKDPRVIRTRKMIQEALMTMAEKKDFEAITVKDIAAKATINRATFYAHYIDKYDVLDEVISNVCNEMVWNRIQPEQEFTGETGRELIMLIYEYHVKFYKECRMDARSIAARVENQVKMQLQKIIADMLANGKRFGECGHDKIVMTATMISSAIYSSTQLHYIRGNVGNLDDMIVTTLSFVISGMEAILESEMP